MKNINKFLVWITSGIFVIISAVFISLYAVERQQNTQYKETIARNAEELESKDKQLQRNIKIKVDALDNDEDREITYKNVLVFKENNEIRTLQDLLETKINDFILGKKTSLGRMVEQIKGQSKWIEGIYSKGSWWKISSLDYVKKYPDKQLQGKTAEESGDLNVGVKDIYLIDDFTFTFTQMLA